MAYAGEPGSLAPGAARCKRSRTMSDFETPRRRDSASIAAAIASGKRTVNVFIGILYYMPAIDEIHAFNAARLQRLRHGLRDAVVSGALNVTALVERIRALRAATCWRPPLPGPG